MEARRVTVRNLRALTAVELDGKARDLKKELFNLRFQAAAGRVENPAKIKQTRRDIARVKTVLREKAVGGPPGRQAEGA
ncbi:MAG TPA: 50S ribosomal protein L29 [Nitrospirales bacterium]|nr:50S ribosomal protein L29 [Nitrospirales bacterium]